MYSLVFLRTLLNVLSSRVVSLSSIFDNLTFKYWLFKSYKRIYSPNQVFVLFHMFPSLIIWILLLILSLMGYICRYSWIWFFIVRILVKPDINAYTVNVVVSESFSPLFSPRPFTKTHLLSDLWRCSTVVYIRILEFFDLFKLYFTSLRQKNRIYRTNKGYKEEMYHKVTSLIMTFSNYPILQSIGRYTLNLLITISSIKYKSFKINGKVLY